jgi:hypothetical protein
MYFENKIILEYSFIHLTENRLACLIKPFLIYSCPRMGFTRGEKNIFDFTQKLQRNNIIWFI